MHLTLCIEYCHCFPEDMTLISLDFFFYSCLHLDEQEMKLSFAGGLDNCLIGHDATPNVKSMRKRKTPIISQDMRLKQWKNIKFEMFYPKISLTAHQSPTYDAENDLTGMYGFNSNSACEHSFSQIVC